MKIAFVRARYSAHGGAERFAARAIEALGGVDRIEVSILARRWNSEGGPMDAVDAPGAVPAAATRVIRCDPFYLGSTWRDASFAAAVRKRLAEERFDLVQSHERIVGLPIYRAGDGVHAAWLERRGRSLSRLRRAALAVDGHHRYLLRTERAMFEHPALDAVICNSRLVSNEIATRFAIDPVKLVLIRNGVDVERFRPDASGSMRGRTRSALGLGAQTPTFVLVGSGFERKGVALALDALADTADAVLLVVGADKHARRYRERAASLGLASRVRFVGAVDDPRPFLAAADAFVLPTLYDPFPNAALEAWACGLPVLTSTASGAAELVEEGVNGWVVDAYDRAPLATAMRQAAGRDAARIETMARAARATALPLSLTVLADRLGALYRRLLDRA